ncbi:MAG TPA: MBL fold metallo-hydrolase [Thermodesulfobacteriota bacterium]|nr:MBL fold metallo-hydrolase [Thermodesulfobacteriota bacterium]
MKIKWYGHAAFLITSAQGVKIITDPYESGGFGGAIGYGPIPDEADIVLVSHDHADHNHVKGLPGKPHVVNGAGAHKAKGFEFTGIPAYHDGSKGSQRGQNTIFRFDVDGLRFCHLGDLGHVPGEKEAARIGAVDILMIPVGGFYTIDPLEAGQTIQILRPRISIPMHYKNSKCGFPLASLEEFTNSMTKVRAIEKPEWEITKETLPREPEVIVLPPAL